ncbi:MAG: SCO family protein [Proteobacteria bacterium]|nr:SCO family protein [Pseudomonadota bacterium]
MSSPSSKQSVIRYFLWGLCCILLVALLLQYKYIFTPSAKIHNIEGKSFVPMDLGGDFSLIDQYGKRISSKSTSGKIRIVYFGYTYCPDLCPMALTHITEALELLEKDRSSVATYFITIDPKRDTVEKLKEYSLNFHPDILMLTGSPDELQKVMKLYKVISQKVEDKKMSDYLIDHSTFIYILNEEGQVVDVLPHTTSGEKIMQTVSHHLFYKGQ